MDRKKKAAGLMLVVLAVIGLAYLGFGGDIFTVNRGGVETEDPTEDPGEEVDNNKDPSDGEGREGQDSESEDRLEDARGDISFLLLGLDDGGRTDTIMVCKYFADSGGVSILSIPRDTRVEIEGRGLERVNHAHVYGGAELTLETLNNFLGMKLEDYVRVDFKMVEEIVDILGGVEVDVPDGIYGFQSGVQTLNGQDALEVLRHRASYSNQDIGRIDFQQRFLVSLIDQVVSSRNLSDLASMVRSGRANIDTSFSTVKTIRYIMKLRDVRTDKVETATLSGEHRMIDNMFYIIVDQDEAKAMARRLFSNR